MKYFTQSLTAFVCPARHTLLSFLVATALAGPGVAPAQDLRFTAYLTSDSTRAMLDQPTRDAAIKRLNELQISGVILETSRGDETPGEADLVLLREAFVEAGFRVSGGIATVPGSDWGVPASEGLAWLNYSAPKTQADIEAAVRTTARVFDRFIVDDFLLSGDKSPEADAARRGRSWPQYRRDLLTALSQRMIIGPAREENPNVTVVLKFPQSYDRYHTFGYDVAREPQLYDAVWVGTETRGQYTQRFGFTQPYEGFVNYRWIDSLSHGKLGGAWFDFGDCDEADYIEQAWQSVLAGAREIVLFSFGGIDSPHPGNARLLQERPALEQLARAVADHPVTGVAAYKPPNSDPASDMYLMDYIGMLGVPLVPVSQFPEDAPSLFIPAYGAKDPDITQKIETALAAGKSVVITTGLLALAPDNGRLATLAGLVAPPQSTHRRTYAILVDGQSVSIPNGLDLGGLLAPVRATVVLEALLDGQPVPYLTTCALGSGRLSVLNVHQFTWDDFESANEVLLSPRDLGLLQLPQAWANAIRAAFRAPGELEFDAPTRVAFQPLSTAGWFIQNYNNEPVTVTVRGSNEAMGALHDGFSGAPIATKGNEVQWQIPERSRWWVAR